VGNIGDDDAGYNIGYNIRDEVGNGQGISYC